MKIRIGYDLVFDCPRPTPVILILKVHTSRAQDLLVPDRIVTEPSIPVDAWLDSFDNRCARILAPEGGEQIMEAAMAIRHGIPVRAIASAFHPYLTQSEAVKLCAQAFDKDVAKMSCCA